MIEIQRHLFKMATIALMAGPLCGCAGTAAEVEALRPAVKAYNHFIRWNKFDSAMKFRAPEEQTDFLARYLAVEDDLHVESIEIRAINWEPEVEGKPAEAKVVLVALAYLLPSTVLEKFIITQDWQWDVPSESWRLAKTSKELAPPLEPDPSDPKDSPEAPVSGHDSVPVH